MGALWLIERSLPINKSSWIQKPKSSGQTKFHLLRQHISFIEFSSAFLIPFSFVFSVLTFSEKNGIQGNGFKMTELMIWPTNIRSFRRASWGLSKLFKRTSKALPVQAFLCAFGHLFVWLGCVWAFVRFALVWLFISRPFIQILLLWLGQFKT